MTWVRTIRPRLAGRRGGQSGIALVELAVLLPILLVLSFGAIEFARAISAYGALVNQVRVGARYLSSKVPGQGHAEAKCLVVYGVAAATCSGTPLVAGLTLDQVSVMDASQISSMPTHRAQATGSATGHVSVNLVTVRISGYSHRLIGGGVLAGIFRGSSTIAFSTISTTMRQQL